LLFPSSSDLTAEEIQLFVLVFTRSIDDFHVSHPLRASEINPMTNTLVERELRLTDIGHLVIEDNLTGYWFRYSSLFKRNTAIIAYVNSVKRQI